MKTTTSITATPSTVINNEGWLRFTLSSLACGADPRSEHTVTIDDIEAALWSTHALGLAADTSDDDGSARVFSVNIPKIGLVTWWTDRDYHGLEVGVFHMTYQRDSSYTQVSGASVEIAAWLRRSK